MARIRHRPRHLRPGGPPPQRPPPPAGVRLLPRRVPCRAPPPGPPIRLASIDVNGLTLQSAWAVETLIEQRNFSGAEYWAQPILGFGMG